MIKKLNFSILIRSCSLFVSTRFLPIKKKSHETIVLIKVSNYIKGNDTFDFTGFRTNLLFLYVNFSEIFPCSSSIIFFSLNINIKCKICANFVRLKLLFIIFVITFCFPSNTGSDFN